LINAGDIGPFCILSEDAVQKGSRRIIALSGSAALEAIELADDMERRVDAARTTADVKTLTNATDRANIPTSRKAVLRNKIQKLRKALDAETKKKRDAMAANAKTRAAEIIANGPGALVVEVLDVGANPKAIGEAMKILKESAPDTACMFFGVEEGKVAYSCQVPQVRRHPLPP